MCRDGRPFAAQTADALSMAFIIHNVKVPHLVDVLHVHTRFITLSLHLLARRNAYPSREVRVIRTCAFQSPGCTHPGLRLTTFLLNRTLLQSIQTRQLQVTVCFKIHAPRRRISGFGLYPLASSSSPKNRQLAASHP